MDFVVVLAGNLGRKKELFTGCILKIPMLTWNIPYFNPFLKEELRAEELR